LVNLGPIRIQKGFESLAATLAEQIVTGVIKRGQLLPNERSLGEISGLSRGSVREALRVLEAQGLVSTKLGRNGGRVASPPSDEIFRRSIDFFIRGQRIALSEMMETVEILEPNLAQLAAKNRNDDDITRLKAASKTLTTATTPARFVNANTRWHKAMATASHNALLIAIYESFGADLLNPRISGFISDEIRAEVIRAVDHVERAIIAGDAEAARRRMVKHIKGYRASVEAATPGLDESPRAASNASAMEKVLVRSESARDGTIRGTAAPTTMDARSNPAKQLSDL
jgi:DNA-binding FadR family transcriptional regulator